MTPEDSHVKFTELRDLALMFSELPLEREHLEEVHSAVMESLENGYDEEYMLRDIIAEPGRGVGSDRLDFKSAVSLSESSIWNVPEEDIRNMSACLSERSACSLESSESANSSEPAITPKYQRPLRALISDYLAMKTKSGTVSSDDMLEALGKSDAQIYWPYSERWDGEQFPVITFSPGTDAQTNIGYEMLREDDGRIQVRQVTVDEKMAMERPVWVLNSNDDCGYESIELRRRMDPEWGQAGEVYVKCGDAERKPRVAAMAAKSPDNPAKTGEEDSFPTLYLKDLMLGRNYDTWFCGASEVVVHCGSVSGFTASTEAELKLYTPGVTNFMISVPRSKVGERIPFNAVLISDFTPQLEMFAFLLNEDDGGTQTSWKTEATVKIQSKSYGFILAIPLNIHDDIIWRGQLSSAFFLKNSGKVGHFGDVSLTFLLE